VRAASPVALAANFAPGDGSSIEGAQ
jgi:hypothetical protein